MNRRMKANTYWIVLLIWNATLTWRLTAFWAEERVIPTILILSRTSMTLGSFVQIPTIGLKAWSPF